MRCSRSSERSGCFSLEDRKIRDEALEMFDRLEFCLVWRLTSSANEGKRTRRMATGNITVAETKAAALSLAQDLGVVEHLLQNWPGFRPQRHLLTLMSRVGLLRTRDKVSQPTP